MKFDDIFKPAVVDKTVEKAVGRYNVAPIQHVAIIERTAEGDRHASTTRWSLVPRWAKSIKEKTAVDQRPFGQGPDVKAVEVARGAPRGPHPDPRTRLV